MRITNLPPSHFASAMAGPSRAASAQQFTGVPPPPPPPAPPPAPPPPPVNQSAPSQKKWPGVVVENVDNNADSYEDVILATDELCEEDNSIDQVDEGEGENQQEGQFVIAIEDETPTNDQFEDTTANNLATMKKPLKAKEPSTAQLRSRAFPSEDLLAEFFYGKRKWYILGTFLFGVALSVLGILLFFIYFRIRLRTEYIVLDSLLPSELYNASLASGMANSTTTDLKIFLNSIRICEKLLVKSLGISGEDGCFSIYESSSPVTDYPAVTLKEFVSRASLQNHWQVTSKESFGSLVNQNLTLNGNFVRSYSYVVFSISRISSLKTTIKLGNGGFLISGDARNAPDFSVDPDGAVYTLAEKNLRDNGSREAEEAIIPLTQSKIYGKLIVPWSLSSDNIFNRNDWNIGLILNTDSIVKGGFEADLPFGNLRDRFGNSILVQAPSINAIYFRPGDTIIQEIYLMSIPSRKGSVVLKIFSVWTNTTTSLPPIQSASIHTYYGQQNSIFENLPLLPAIAPIVNSVISSPLDPSRPWTQNTQFRDYTDKVILSINRGADVRSLSELAQYAENSKGQKVTAKLRCVSWHGWNDCVPENDDIEAIAVLFDIVLIKRN